MAKRKKKPKDVSKNIERLCSYLRRMEDRRSLDERGNRRSYQEAREMSAWLSLYEYGAPWAKELAKAALLEW